MPKNATPAAIDSSDILIKYSVADEAPHKTITNVYKTFFARNGKLYPPMVANLTAEEQQLRLAGQHEKRCD